MEYISKRWMIDLDIGPSPPSCETSMQFLTYSLSGRSIFWPKKQSC